MKLRTIGYTVTVFVKESLASVIAESVFFFFLLLQEVKAAMCNCKYCRLAYRFFVQCRTIKTLHTWMFQPTSRRWRYFTEI